jgi:hypothetical protein
MRGDIGKVVVEVAATIKESTARSASFCLVVGATSRDAPDSVDAPKPIRTDINFQRRAGQNLPVC